MVHARDSYSTVTWQCILLYFLILSAPVALFNKCAQLYKWKVK